MKKTIKYIVGLIFSTILLGGLWACGESRTPSISAPENIFLCHNQTTDDTTEYILKWDRVKNAGSYKITAYGKTFETTKNEYDLTSYVQLNKSSQITVQAISKTDDFSDSQKKTALCKAEEITPRLVYTKRNDGSYEVSRNWEDSEPLEGKLNLPDSYDEIYINKISDYGFTFSNGAIGGIEVVCAADYTAIRFPTYLISIGECAFSSAEKLLTVNIPATTVSIGLNAFAQCRQLKSVSLPDGITGIGAAAFNLCNSLQSVPLPNSLKSISEMAFAQCKNLSEIIIPASVKEIGSWAFQNCEKLSNVIFEENSGLLSIGEAAFSHCTSLAKITLPESLTFLDLLAFYETPMKNLHIPKNTNMAEGAICNSAFQQLTIDESNPYFNLVDGVIFSEDGKSLFAYPAASQRESYTLPQGIETVCEYAFRHAQNLKSVHLSDEIKQLGDYSFYEAGITAIEFPYGLERIGAYAFQNCNGLTELTLPASIEEIGYFAFYHANNLKTLILSKGIKIKTLGWGMLTSNVEHIEIPEGVERMEAYVFHWSTNLKSVIFPKSLKYLSGAVLQWAAPQILIYADVFYKGTEEDWQLLKEAHHDENLNYPIERFEDNFNQLNVYFYSEEEPRVKEDWSGYDGNYWHYADDGITPVVWEL